MKHIRKRCENCKGHSYSTVFDNGQKSSGSVHYDECPSVDGWHDEELPFEKPDPWFGELPSKTKNKELPKVILSRKERLSLRKKK